MKQKTILYHLGGWLLVIAYDLINIWRDGGKNAPVNMLLQFSFCLSMISVFYYCFLFVYPRFFKKGKTLQFIVALLLVPVVFSTTRYLLEQVLYPPLFNVSNYYGNVNLWYYLLDNLYYGVAVTVVSAAIWSAQQAFNQQEENETLRKEKQQAELAFLQSQINPHFLYNTLNYIYSLAYPVSEPLADAIIKLSQLMRYTLHESADGKVDLQQDLDYLQNYIDIYRLRFEDRFFVDFKAEGDLTSKRIASLMLIPFVENAFKHGVVNDAQRPVKIHLKIIANRLMVTVSNKINRNQKDQSSGIGLANTRRRLALIYPGRHELLIADNGQSYKTTLNIDL
jgi:two-component system LytT family sensor kinase